MPMKSIIRARVFISATTLAALPYVVFAQELPFPIGRSITDVLCRIAVGSFRIALAASLIAFLVGAWFYLTSTGNPEKMSKGKKAFIYAIYGVAVVMLSAGAAFIIGDLLGGVETALPACNLI